MFFSLLLMFILTACESSNDSEGDPSLRGEGFIVLDGARHDFDVIACDISGEVDEDYQTISGRGETSDGERFDVFVSRNDAGGILMHSVSFQTGNVAQGEGTVIEAQRMHMNGNWSDLHGGPNEPLIQISGSTVTAQGAFTVNEDLDNPIEGSLEATCN